MIDPTYMSLFLADGGEEAAEAMPPEVEAFLSGLDLEEETDELEPSTYPEDDGAGWTE